MTKDRSKSCSFTGHRLIDKALYGEISEKLSRIIDKLYERGVRHFISGGAIGFDTIAAVAVLNKKATLPDITLTIAVPFRGQSERWSVTQKALYDKILSRADEVRVLSEHYHNACMGVRNRFMVDNSAYCIAYVTEKSGGSVYTLNYAKKQGLMTLNIGGELAE